MLISVIYRGTISFFGVIIVLGIFTQFLEEIGTVLLFLSSQYKCHRRTVGSQLWLFHCTNMSCTDVDISLIKMLGYMKHSNIFEFCWALADWISIPTLRKWHWQVIRIGTLESLLEREIHLIHDRLIWFACYSFLLYSFWSIKMWVSMQWLHISLLLFSVKVLKDTETVSCIPFGL